MVFLGGLHSSGPVSCTPPRDPIVKRPTLTEVLPSTSDFPNKGVSFIGSSQILFEGKNPYRRLLTSLYVPCLKGYVSPYQKYTVWEG